MSHAFERLENCLEDFKKWLSANKLKLNPDKTEFIVFGSKMQREKLNKSFPVNIRGNFLSPVTVPRNLGVWFDSEFSFLGHVQNICKSCSAQIRDLKHLRDYLTHHATLMAANALVGSRLVYCNSLFRSLSALDLRKLQCVQNSLARIVTNTTKYSHITPVRKILHWLPIEHRSIFKTALLVYKLLNCGHPKYFVPFLKPRQSVYNNTHKSQADSVFLEVPHFATSIYKSSKYFVIIQKEAQNLSRTSIPTLTFAFTGFSPWRRPLLCLRFMIIVSCFCLVHLESVFRWRLGAIKYC